MVALVCGYGCTTPPSSTKHAMPLPRTIIITSYYPNLPCCLIDFIVGSSRPSFACCCVPVFLVLVVIIVVLSVDIFSVKRLLPCSDRTYHPTVFYEDIVKGGEFTSCQFTAILSHITRSNITIFSHDCDTITNHNHLIHENKELETLGVASFSILDSNRNYSSYFPNGLDSTLIINASSAGNVNLSICEYTDAVEYNHFLNPTTQTIPAEIGVCEQLHIKASIATKKIKFASKAASYYFIGIRVNYGKLDSLWYHFTAIRGYYDINDFKDDIKCTASVTSPNKCSNISLPYSRTCVMLYAHPDETVGFNHLQLHGVKNLKAHTPYFILYITLFAVAFVVAISGFVYACSILICTLNFNR